MTHQLSPQLPYGDWHVFKRGEKAKLVAEHYLGQVIISSSFDFERGQGIPDSFSFIQYLDVSEVMSNLQNDPLGAWVFSHKELPRRYVAANVRHSLLPSYGSVLWQVSSRVSASTSLTRSYESAFQRVAQTLGARHEAPHILFERYEYGAPGGSNRIMQTLLCHSTTSLEIVPGQEELLGVLLAVAMSDELKRESAPVMTFSVLENGRQAAALPFKSIITGRLCRELTRLGFHTDKLVDGVLAPMGLKPVTFDGLMPEEGHELFF